jgi:predicted ATPase
MLTQHLSDTDSMLASVADPQRAPEMMAVREAVRGWRFHDHFRTDSDSPSRVAQIGTFTPVLHHDGSNLAAALQTILEIRSDDALTMTLGDAFLGGRLSVEEQNGSFELLLRQHGLLRTLSAAELSDGTLRYLLLAAALLTPRPPELMVLNEPETSLHPDLLPALARLILAAAKKRADHRGVARAATHRGTDDCALLHSPPSTKGIWRNEAGGLDVIQHTEMELACPVGPGLRAPSTHLTL